jgi:hypothetical protein
MAEAFVSSKKSYKILLIVPNNTALSGCVILIEPPAFHFDTSRPFTYTPLNPQPKLLAR